MKHIALTPFGQRPVTAGLLASRALAETAADHPAIDKWTVLTRLRIARTRFAVTDRDLTVLAALLSFLPEREMKGEHALGGALVVFPSNAALSDRAYGMAESTLRRHLGALVSAGLILRQDSANGKRYAVRRAGGVIDMAYGFDLRPLLARAAAISHAAQEIEMEAAMLARQRTALVLRLRDSEKLLAYAVEEGRAGDWAALSDGLAAVRRGLRRRMEATETAELGASLALIEAQIVGITDRTPVTDTEEMDANASQSERHHLNSNSEDSDLEPCQELDRAQSRGDLLSDPDQQESGQGADLPRLPLQLVLKACPDILPYAGRPISSWAHLVAAADQVRGMMGISPSAWTEARLTMGPATAAVALAGILQRFSDIRNAGGYLRSLTRQANEGRFTPGPMIMALLAGGGANGFQS